MKNTITKLENVTGNKVPFTKMSLNGNDFILIDKINNKINIPNLRDFSLEVCSRKTSVGADGLIVIEKSDKADFKVQFFNCDGTEEKICGNAFLCVTKLSNLLRISSKIVKFEVYGNIIESEFSNEISKIKINDIYKVFLNITLDSHVLHFVDIGIPHVIKIVDDISNVSMLDGKKIRDLSGSYVDFVKRIDQSHIFLRTYEKWVEDETLSCGTGAIASSIVLGKMNLIKPPVSVRTKGGFCIVDFIQNKDVFQNISLQGRSKIVCSGVLEERNVSYSEEINGSSI